MKRSRGEALALIAGGHVFFNTAGSDNAITAFNYLFGSTVSAQYGNHDPPALFYTPPRGTTLAQNLAAFATAWEAAMNPAGPEPNQDQSLMILPDAEAANALGGASSSVTFPVAHNVPLNVSVTPHASGIVATTGAGQKHIC